MMKLNWGWGIFIAFVAFIGFILFFVVRMNTDHRAGHDLVTEEYYKAELEYQQEIDAAENARKHALQLAVEKTADGLLVKFPMELEPKKIKGSVSMYRPSDKYLDFDFPIRLSGSYLLIPVNRLPHGRWDLKVAWEYENQKYLYKESITY